MICQRDLKTICLRIGAVFFTFVVIAVAVVFNVAGMVFLWSICS